MGGPRQGDGAGSDPRLTERRNPRTRGIDRVDVAGIVDLILAEERRVPDAVAREREAIARLVRLCVDRMRSGGRLLYLGAGTSGRLGQLDAVECPPTFGTDPRLVRALVAGGEAALVRSVEGAEDDAEAGREAVREAEVGSSDLVVGIATSGTTPFVLAGLEEAAARGAATGFLSCSEPPAPIRELADVLVTPPVGPEAIAGSTRMKAGTATKLVLNALTTTTMIRLGKVYDNLMVDLQAVSRKLVGRSVRIVGDVAGMPAAEARRLLLAAGGSAKTAIVMSRLRVGRAMAERALDACDGFVAEALDRFGDGRIPCYTGYPEAADPESRRALVRRFRGGPARLAEALSARRDGASEPEDGSEPTLVSPPAGWSAAHHLAHLIEFDREAVRPRLIGFRDGTPSRFAEVTTSPEPTDADRPAAELLDAFGAERAVTAERLPSPGDPAWERRIEIGDESPNLYQFLRGVAQHDRAHELRLRERVHRDLLAAGDPPPGFV